MLNHNMRAIIASSISLPHQNMTSSPSLKIRDEWMQDWFGYSLVGQVSIQLDIGYEQCSMRRDGRRQKRGAIKAMVNEIKEAPQTQREKKIMKGQLMRWKGLTWDQKGILRAYPVQYTVHPSSIAHTSAGKKTSLPVCLVALMYLSI